MQKQKNIEIHVDSNDDAKIIFLMMEKALMKKTYNYVSKDMLPQKISNNDLSRIQTLGFRGEALYAIASVSKIEIISKTSNMESAVKIIVEENKVLENKPAKGKEGTHIVVKNLFKNFPVRKKFLSNAKAENYYIKEVIKSIAISHPEISFNYFENTKPKLVLLNRIKGKVLKIE